MIVPHVTRTSHSRGRRTISDDFICSCSAFSVGKRALAIESYIVHIDSNVMISQRSSTVSRTTKH